MLIRTIMTKNALERQQHQPLHHVVPADGEAPARVDERGGVVRERAGHRKVARELGQRVHHAEHHHGDERVADQDAAGPAVSERLGGAEKQAGANRPAQRDHLHLERAELVFQGRVDAVGDGGGPEGG
ncbi:hypothetical protein KL930_004329 [Ogataea haglerorum]|uniref:Uncharacterized protein n=1 Tax=Ogataea haglerorum TaxID=1937702 RepID=A0AAN6D2R4_9ASCO|nr:uncharacterized protein KL911_004184 [Ogataea haglerorum]KAG7692980.1 hypothetical protein KL915_004436 [Ogataea haglerorum]KAG7693835.1 hypothetical protein KL951_004314 [Ogataea haglerorum]KAG7704306.1 hypothetical protein KL914_004293 [Ogataea haglerorum]KAG7704492.1 hypothetical protein KL950_004299 [Ogataea haglerorum]KAG7715887.1 hypothetical protein KL913_003700 [Ogataea haglerorum]